MPSGLLFESITAAIGIFNLVASWIAICSLTVSRTNIKSGNPPISFIPPIDVSNLSFSRFNFSNSFFVRPEDSSLSRDSSIDLNLAIVFEIVFQLVNVPPYHLWFI